MWCLIIRIDSAPRGGGQALFLAGFTGNQEEKNLSLPRRLLDLEQVTALPAPDWAHLLTLKWTMAFPIQPAPRVAVNIY